MWLAYQDEEGRTYYYHTGTEECVWERPAEYEEPEKVKQHYRSQPQMMQGLRAMVIEEQVVDHILASATVTDKSMPLEELLNQRQGG